MNDYICDNCTENSDTLISHPWVTGSNNSYCPKCFQQMATVLHDLKKHCPVCKGAVHDDGCIAGRLREKIVPA